MEINVLHFVQKVIGKTQQYKLTINVPYAMIIVIPALDLIMMNVQFVEIRLIM